MTREQLEAKVRELMRDEFINRPDMRDKEDRIRLMMGDMYSKLGSEMFIYDLLDTPGVLEAVLQYSRTV